MLEFSRQALDEFAGDRNKRPVLTLSVVSEDGAGRDVGAVRDVAGQDGHGRLKHRHIRGMLLFDFGARLHYLVTASGDGRGCSVEMIERIHVKHHFSSYWQKQFLIRSLGTRRAKLPAVFIQ